MTMKAILTALLLGSAMTTVHADAQRFERTTGGVKVTPAGGSAASVEVSVHGDGIIHVVTTPKGAGTASRAPSLMVAQPPAAGEFEVAESAGQVRITTRKATAEVALATGQVRFLDPSGKPLLAEAGPVRFAAATADGKRGALRSRPASEHANGL
jgi:alpha-D-xyloside xylohydrolase